MILSSEWLQRSLPYHSSPDNNREHEVSPILELHRSLVMLTRPFCWPPTLITPRLGADLEKELARRATRQQNCDLTAECVPLRLDVAIPNVSGHSLTQRTETAICFWPWGPR